MRNAQKSLHLRHQGIIRLGPPVEKVPEALEIIASTEHGESLVPL
jgi:hypothetical protein